MELYAPGQRPASAGCQTVRVRPGLRLTRALAALGGSGALFVYAFSGGPARAADQTVQATAQNQFSPASVTIAGALGVIAARTGERGDAERALRLLASSIPMHLYGENFGPLADIFGAFGKPAPDFLSTSLIFYGLLNVVTWQWAGGFGHTVTSSSANWSKDTALGPPSATLSTSQIFDKPGTYTYVCKTHGPAMKGTVVVKGTVKPKPTKTPSRSPSPTRTSSSPRPSASSPEPSASSATPVLPSVTVPPGGTATPSAPAPSVAPSPTESKFLGEGGLTAPPATGRGKGLPVMLALLLIGGVGSAEIRAFLSEEPY